MTLLENYSKHYETNPLRYLHTFDFTFGCNQQDYTDDGADNHQRRASIDSQNEIFGTGGKLLEGLRGLMSQLIGSKNESNAN